eukprot:3523930-Amphidinium_carterae.1
MECRVVSWVQRLLLANSSGISVINPCLSTASNLAQSSRMRSPCKVPFGDMMLPHDTLGSLASQ